MPTRSLPKKTDPAVPRDAVVLPADVTSETWECRSEVWKGPPLAALVFEDEALQAFVASSLRETVVLPLGATAMDRAAVVLTDGRPNVASAMAKIRSGARSDAAIIVVVSAELSDSISAAHAAGAFACVRVPFEVEELAGLIDSALDARAAKGQIADLTKQLDLQSHLASIGRITAGLAHELGNPLSVAMMNVQAVQGECAPLFAAVDLLRKIATLGAADGAQAAQMANAFVDTNSALNDVRAALDDAVASHGRMAALLASLRELVGRESTAFEDVELRSLVHDAQRWAGDALTGVEVEMVGSPAIVHTSRTMLEQILVNLIANAAHAAKSLSSPHVRLHVYTAGDHAVVSIRDNGPGIPAALHERIFEPFYTTRRGRGGIGLGLALCREYAAQMGAELSLWSIPGRGACFRVHLPRKK